MKKILALFLTLFFVAGITSADHRSVIARKNVSGEDCTCTGTGDWETGIVERFEDGVDDFCTNDTGTADWSAPQEGGGGVINTYDNAEAKTCTYSLSSADNSADASEYAYVIANITDTAGFAVDMWVKINNVTSWANGNYAYFFNIQGPNRGVRFHMDFTTLRIGSSMGTGELGVTTILVDTWYKVHVDFNQNGAHTVLVYNPADELIETLDTGTMADTAATSLRFGNTYSTVAVAAQYTIYTDNVTFDSDGD